MADSVSERPGGLAATVAKAARLLDRQLPGLIHENTHIFSSAEDLLNSDYAKQHPFTDKERADIATAEGFFDKSTSATVIIAGNIALRKGESASQAFTRVVIHERIGHDGINLLLGDKRFKQRWQALGGRIPKTELEAIAAEEAYQDLANKPNELALEWLARRTETDPTLLEKPGLVREMWEAFKERIRTVFEALGLTDLDKRDFDAEVRSLLHQASDRAIKGRDKSETTHHPDGSPKDRLAFSIPMRQDKPNSWEEVRTGHSWMSSKRFLPKLKDARPEAPKRGSFDELLNNLAEELKTKEPEVTDPWGARVLMANPQGEGVFKDRMKNRAAHLLGEKKDRKVEVRTEHPDKIAWSGAIWNTVKDAQVRVRAGYETLYFRSYAEGVHMVVTANGAMKDQFMLISQYNPKMAKHPFGANAVVEKVRRDPSRQ